LPDLASRAAAVTSAGRRNIVGIQLLRAVAATSVVIAHVHYDLIEHLSLRQVLPDLLAWGGAGVDLFFVISGFVMVYASEKLFGESGASLTFLTRRVSRVVPLYWLMSAIMLAYVAARGFLPSDASPMLAVASFLFIPYPRPSGVIDPLYGVGWTLNYEMFFYAVFALAVVLRREVAVAGIAGAFVVFVMVNQYVGGLPLPLSYWADPIILEFVFGMLIALVYRIGVRLSPVGALLLVLAALAAFAACATIAPTIPRWLAFGVPAAQMVAAFALVRRDIRLRWIEPLGDASYALYLTHPVVIAAARVLSQKGYLMPAAMPWAYCMGIVLAAIALSLAVYRYVEVPLTARARAVLSVGARRSLPA
jgi:peptidoglycan/LPS O-acetylase OafA/YrhL